MDSPSSRLAVSVVVSFHWLALVDVLFGDWKVGRRDSGMVALCAGVV